MRSVWNTFGEKAGPWPALQGKQKTGVAIVGGGITGISLAVRLAEEGVGVTVLEARNIGGGTTAHSTGNLYVTLDQGLSSLEGKYDLQKVAQIVAARREAIDRIERNTETYSLDCDFARRPWTLYSGSGNNIDFVGKERDTAVRAGLAVEDTPVPELPFEVSAGIRIQGQAQINPRLYVEGLARSGVAEGVRIFENSRVEEIREEAGGVVLKTPQGEIRADVAVHATHTPKGRELLFHSHLGPAREYGVAAVLRSGQEAPEGIFWGYHEGASRISIRSCNRNGEKVVMVLGEPHKTGQHGENRNRAERLREFMETHFEVEGTPVTWGGQNYKPSDMLPYIGTLKSGSRILLATGFSTDGLVYGTLAAMILSDSITGSGNRWAHLFDPQRVQPSRSAKKFLKENLNVGAEYLKRLPFNRDDTEFKSIEPGEGKIIEKTGRKIAAYRTETGDLKLRSAICTHMGCVVQWNQLEKSWDCPCHASRFDTDGEVIEGPAFQGLNEVETKEKQP